MSTVLIFTAGMVFGGMAGYSLARIFVIRQESRGESVLEEWRRGHIQGGKK